MKSPELIEPINKLNQHMAFALLSGRRQLLAPSKSRRCDG
jgi:hypothetical protein